MLTYVNNDVNLAFPLPTIVF
uniref:Uncharacterized protein n=1 Tax=Lepeophtheirus salmonis TaxID=72036 RepID=A0A0K2TMS6_LEPSM